MSSDPRTPDSDDGDASEKSGDVETEWSLTCLDCDFSMQIDAKGHPRDGPPDVVRDRVTTHKHTTDASHVVRVAGRRADRDRDDTIDPSLVTDGGRPAAALGDPSDAEAERRARQHIRAAYAYAEIAGEDAAELIVDTLENINDEPPIDRGDGVETDGGEPAASTGGGRHAPAMGGSTTPERTYAHYCDELGSTVYAPRRKCPFGCYEDDGVDRGDSVETDGGLNKCASVGCNNPVATRGERCDECRRNDLRTDGGSEFSERVDEMIEEIEYQIEDSTPAEAMLYARCSAAFEDAINNTDLPPENGLGVMTAALFEAADTVGYARQDVIETAREYYIDEGGDA
jgi:hypothetical protein